MYKQVFLHTLQNVCHYEPMYVHQIDVNLIPGEKLVIIIQKKYYQWINEK